MIPTLKKGFLHFLAACFLLVGLGQGAQAALIGTQELAAAADSGQARLAAQLARPALRAQLEQLGIGAEAAAARVAALSDDEAAQLADRIDQLPAGGDALGLVVAVFAILLLTDILGFTKVYPFTRPIR